jgi:hypothetical protein
LERKYSKRNTKVEKGETKMRVKRWFQGTVRWVALIGLLAILLLSSLTASSAEEASLQPDPGADIPWAGPETFANIAAAFNNARNVEQAELGWVPALPNLVMPFTEAEWSAMSDDERALWLIQQERAARGHPPMDGWESNVAGVAQAYADWMVTNNEWGHYKDGHNPTWRLEQNAAINACNDGGFGENLTIFVGGGPRDIPIALSIYMWMYEDIGFGWGHRHLILASYGGGDACGLGVEGFLGIGHAGGDGYCPPDVAAAAGWNCADYPYGENVVMNTFDPCGTWDPCGPTAAGLSCFKTAPVEGVGSLVGLVCLGVLAGTGFMAQHRRRKG